VKETVTRFGFRQQLEGGKQPGKVHWLEEKSAGRERREERGFLVRGARPKESS